MSNDLYEIVKQNAKKAVELDRAGKTDESVTHYITAAETLHRLITFTRNPQLKDAYYQRAKEYINRVKEIKGGEVTSSGDSKDDEDGIDVSSMFNFEKPNIKWEDVAGMEEAKKSLKEAVILPMARPDLFKGARKSWKGILMFGPPGCGKSYLAKAIASQVDATFFSVSAASVMSKWVGEAEKTVKKMYKVAREKAPSIVFIDECEALAGARSAGENESLKRVKTELLQAIEGVGVDEGKIVVTLGATNLPWDIDMAMRRRFQKRVYITLPDRDARLRMFQIHTKGVNLEPDVEFENLADWSVGYTSADISLIANDALMEPIREIDAEELANNKDLMPRNPNMQDFLDAFETRKPSIAADELDKYVKWEDEFGA
ncbi:MAG: AAA family ATPase [Candidatus Hodarchaeales archaeon]